MEGPSDILALKYWPILILLADVADVKLLTIFVNIFNIEMNSNKLKTSLTESPRPP